MYHSPAPVKGLVALGASGLPLEWATCKDRFASLSLMTTPLVSLQFLENPVVLEQQADS